METSGPDKKYLTQRELLDRWRGEIKLATLTTWRSRKQGPPYVKVGGKVLYPLGGVEEYEKRNSR